MKVSRSGAGPLKHGDVVTASVSHNIKINGADAWVKFEVTHTILPTEAPGDVEGAVIDHVSSQVIKLAGEAARKVIEEEGK